MPEGEHAVMALAPGAHELFAYEWSLDVDHRWCAGVMRANVAAGRVYGVRTALYPSLSFHLPWLRSADDLDCFRVPPGEHRAFWDWVRTRSKLRVPTLMPTFAPCES